MSCKPADAVPDTLCKHSMPCCYAIKQVQHNILWRGPTRQLIFTGAAETIDESDQKRGSCLLPAGGLQRGVVPDKQLTLGESQLGMGSAETHLAN